MPRQIIVKADFDRAYRRLSEKNKLLIDAALRRLELYLETGEAPIGLGLTHLGSRTYEFRAGLSLRVVYVAEKDQIFLVLAGTHDEVRRFLKNR